MACERRVQLRVHACSATRVVRCLGQLGFRLGLTRRREIKQQRRQRMVVRRRREFDLPSARQTRIAADHAAHQRADQLKQFAALLLREMLADRHQSRYQFGLAPHRLPGPGQVIPGQHVVEKLVRQVSMRCRPLRLEYPEQLVQALKCG